MKACSQTFPVYAAYIADAVLSIASEMPARQKLNAMGLLLMIANEQRKGRIVTNREIATIIGADESNLLNTVNEFVKIGILVKKQIVNRQGRGKAFELQFADTDDLHRSFGFVPNEDREPKV